MQTTNVTLFFYSVENFIDTLCEIIGTTMINTDLMLLPGRWQTYMGIMTESTATKNQRMFHVYVPELQPEVTGDVQPDFETKSAKIKNVWKGKPQAEEGKMRNILTPIEDGRDVHITKTVYADYWGFNPCEDVPTMYRDMQVVVLNYANLDKWYWIPLERDRSLKTFEHWRLSALDIAVTNKNPGIKKDDIGKRNESITDENSYYIEIDTKYHKGIRMHTCCSDGEKWEYSIEIDPVKQFVEIHDKASDGSQPNNTIKIESKPNEQTKGRIIIQNASGTTVTLTGQDAVVNVPRNMQYIVGGDYQFEVNGNYSERIMGDRTSIVAQQESTEVLGNVNHKYKSNLEEVVFQNKRTCIEGQNEEIQGSRKTTSGTASWESATAFSLTTNLFMGQFQTAQLKTYFSKFESNITYVDIKMGTFRFITHVLQIASTMLWYIPMNVVIPKKPWPTHTLIK